MEETPTGTPVGVDDPYEHVDRCDHCTDDGRCRFAFERFEADPAFAAARRDDGYRCPVADGDWEDWSECPNLRATTEGTACHRCGLGERRMAHSGERPLLEEHHLSYDGAGAGDGESGETDHEITVSLCRWCHAKVHKSWARIDDDASPDPEAIAAREERRGRELQETSFESAAERFGDGE